MELQGDSDRTVYNNRVYAGQAILCSLSISTSFRWDASNTDPKERLYQMQYDVEEMIRDWLVSGRKKGEFIAKVCDDFDSGIRGAERLHIGWGDVHGTVDADSDAPWRASFAKGISMGVASGGTAYDGIIESPFDGDVSETRRREGASTSKRWEDYLRDRDRLVIIRVMTCSE